jgi:hypothetical protein
MQRNNSMPALWDAEFRSNACRRLSTVRNTRSRNGTGKPRRFRMLGPGTNDKRWRS